MDVVDKMSVALIRSLNSARVSVLDSDQDLLDMFGRSARPMAEGLVEVIRDVVREELAAG